MRTRPIRMLAVAILLAVTPAGLAAADPSHEHGTGKYDPPGKSDPCPWKPVADAKVHDFKETQDKETKRRECVVFQHPTQGDTWGSWDPATKDDDPNYSPGDRGQRWGMNKKSEKPAPGQKDGTGAELHYGYHDPKCSQAAQNVLLTQVRQSLARYDGPLGYKRATDEGYVMYPIGAKVWHAYNTGYYDDTDEEGVQRDNDPWHPENIVYAMTDDGWKAMGAMFAMHTAENHLDATGKPKLWKDVNAKLWPQWSTTTKDPVTGKPRLETCNMNWHTHGGAGGTATGGGVDPNTAESDPMSHVWAWGIDMWERGYDGTEANSWWLPYRYIPVICSEYDACI